MAIERGHFTNKKGQKVECIEIDAPKLDGTTYKKKIGFKVAGLILQYEKQIKDMLDYNSRRENPAQEQKEVVLK